MRVHDALRKAFTKYGAYADPWALMELEQFVTAALRGDQNSLRALTDNLEILIKRSEDPNASEKAKEIVDYVLRMCSSGCEG